MGEAAEEFGAVYKDKSVCKVRPSCEYWRNGMGSDVCLKCKTVEKAVGIDPLRGSFTLPEELTENVQASPQIKSLMEAMRGLEMRDKLLYFEFVCERPVSSICDEYGISRAGLYKLAKRVRHHVRHNLGLDE